MDVAVQVDPDNHVDRPIRPDLTFEQVLVVMTPAPTTTRRQRHERALLFPRSAGP
jgi:hypothetical protein